MIIFLYKFKRMDLVRRFSILMCAESRRKIQKVQCLSRRKQFLGSGVATISTSVSVVNIGFLIQNGLSVFKATPPIAQQASPSSLTRNPSFVIFWLLEATT
jgi:hypothetical protein